MKFKDEGMSEKPRKFSISIILYVAASVVALIGVALLVDNIYIFKSTIDQYVTQGYPAATVMKSIIPMQLLPGIFEPIAVYGGIAFILLGVGIGNKKIKINLTKVENRNDAVEESIAEKNVLENTDAIEQAKTVEEIQNS